MSTTDIDTDDDQDEPTTTQTARETETDPASGGPARRRLDRDDDLDPRVGEIGILVSCRCVSCKTVRRKLADDEILEKTADHPSFRHICHDCQRVTWHNTIEILDDVDEPVDDQDDDLDRGDGIETDGGIDQ